MTFFSADPRVVGSGGQKPFSRGRAEPVRGHSTGGSRGAPAPNRRSGSHASRLFTCKGDIHAKSEPC
jgi:hypothetical protein